MKIATMGKFLKVEFVNIQTDSKKKIISFEMINNKTICKYNIITKSLKSNLKHKNLKHAKLKYLKARVIFLCFSFIEKTLKLINIYKIKQVVLLAYNILKIHIKDMFMY